MKILLIAPKNPESFWTFDRILPELGKRCIYPNLALPTLAALTPDEHEVVLCDENVEPIDFDCDADVVGITGYMVHRRRILEIVAELRERGKFVVAGGPFASLCPEELRGRVEVLFIDEAETTWPCFLREFAAGRWQREYRQSEKTDMTAAPLPRFDLLQVDAYQTMTIQFGRGCPYTCEFCDIIVMYGRRPRSKSVEQFMAEVRALRRLGATTIFVVDDNFIANKRQAKALLRSLAEWQRNNGTPIEFMTEVSLNVAQDGELLDLLRAANFRSVFIGIESPREACLRETGKVQNLREDPVASVHRIQRVGIEVMAGMIVGFDHDDAGIFADHLGFIQDASIPVSMTGMLNALPRTPLYARLEQEGRIDNQCSGDQFNFTNIDPHGLSRRALFAGYRDLLEELYDEGNYFDRSWRFIVSRGRMPTQRKLPSWRELTSFVRFVCSRLRSVSNPKSRMALRLVARTALLRPSELRTALALAMVHEHFRGFVGDITDELDRVVEGMEVGGAGSTARQAA